MKERVKIIARTVRRRKFSDAEKTAILAEADADADADADGVSVPQVAERHERSPRSLILQLAIDASSSRGNRQAGFGVHSLRCAIKTTEPVTASAVPELLLDVPSLSDQKAWQRLAAAGDQPESNDQLQLALTHL